MDKIKKFNIDVAIVMILLAVVEIVILSSFFNYANKAAAEAEPVNTEVQQLSEAYSEIDDIPYESEEVVEEVEEYIYVEPEEVEPNYNYGNPNYDREMIQQSTQTMSEEDAKEWIANRESGGSYEAQNGQYWGRYQLNSGWFDGYNQEYILYTDEGHAIQEQKIEEYVGGRYGSWLNAYAHWQSHGWY